MTRTAVRQSSARGKYAGMQFCSYCGTTVASPGQITRGSDKFGRLGSQPVQRLRDHALSKGATSDPGIKRTTGIATNLGQIRRTKFGVVYRLHGVITADRQTNSLMENAFGFVSRWRRELAGHVKEGLSL